MILIQHLSTKCGQAVFTHRTSSLVQRPVGYDVACMP